RGQPRCLVSTRYRGGSAAKLLHTTGELRRRATGVGTSPWRPASTRWSLQHLSPARGERFRCPRDRRARERRLTTISCRQPPAGAARAHEHRWPPTRETRGAPDASPARRDVGGATLASAGRHKGAFGGVEAHFSLAFV